MEAATSQPLASLSRNGGVPSARGSAHQRLRPSLPQSRRLGLCSTFSPSQRTPCFTSPSRQPTLKAASPCHLRGGPVARRRGLASLQTRLRGQQLATHPSPAHFTEVYPGNTAAPLFASSAFPRKKPQDDPSTHTPSQSPSAERAAQQLRAASPAVSPVDSSTGVPGAAAEEAAREAHGGTPVHVYRRSWEFHSERVTVHQRQSRAALAGIPRSVAITVHGCVSEEDAEWLRGQVSTLEGVKEVFVQGRKEGGLRGGAVQLQLEVEPSVKLPALVDAVHGVEERLLALPFKTHSWMWRGHKISYAIAGCGKPVILVHGFGGSAGHFRHLIAHLADEHRVYAVDLLGFGNSDKPADANYGPELWADIINDFTLEFAEEPPVLIGNSIGSLTALAAATQLSERNSVRGLVLLNVAGGMNRKGLMQDDILLKALSPIFIGIEFLLRQPKVASFLFERFRNRANVRKILSQQAYRNSEAVDERLIDILYEPSQDAGALDVFVKVFTGEPGPRPERLVQQLDVPMLVLWGDADPWTPINGKVAKLFQDLESERGNVKVVPLADVGHCPHDDRPELAARHILPWLEALHSLDSAEL